jgi:hypothetical protein
MWKVRIKDIGYTRVVIIVRLRQISLKRWITHFLSISFTRRSRIELGRWHPRSYSSNPSISLHIFPRLTNCAKLLVYGSHWISSPKSECRIRFVVYSPAESFHLSFALIPSPVYPWNSASMDGVEARFGLVIQHMR